MDNFLDNRSALPFFAILLPARPWPWHFTYFKLEANYAKSAAHAIKIAEIFFAAEFFRNNLTRSSRNLDIIIAAVNREF
jgi:hypothetical protein